ncbi:MAG: hypothetical protein IT262_23645 [Saprospiraceae bacterium]|nr:hypothetical protein [Saprospiraceae bacterium]
MLEKIRSALFKKNLRRALATHKRQRKSHTLESARTIGILFDATQEKHKQETLEFARNLEKKGKKVQLLGYLKVKQPPTGLSFDFFIQKELDWIGTPKSEKALAFVKEKMDLLIGLNPDDQAPLAWLAAHAQAAMKIGFITEYPNDFDMILEIPAEKGIRYFTEQLHLYLDKIVLTAK